MKKSEMVTAHSQETSFAIGGILWNSSIFRPLPAPLPPSEEMDLWWPGGDPSSGGDSSAVRQQLQGVQEIQVAQLGSNSFNKLVLML